MGNPLVEGNGLGEESFGHLVPHSPQKLETEKGMVGAKENAIFEKLSVCNVINWKLKIISKQF